MSTNYMSMKDKELLALIEKYDLDKEDYLAESGSVNRKKLSKILKLIDVAAGKVGDGVVIESETGEVVDYDPTRKIHKKLGGMMVQMTFYSVDENEIPYVQLGLNGIALCLPRERKVWVPKEFVEGVLQNAIVTRMKMVVREDGKIAYEHRQVPRFQYISHDIKHVDQLRQMYKKAQRELRK